MAVPNSSVQFEADLKAFAHRVRVDFATAMRRIGLEAFSDIVEYTPVDTGTARGSWVIGVDGVGAHSVFPTIANPKTPGHKGDPIDPGHYLQGSEEIQKFGPNSKVIVISNHLDYIRQLEYGSSKQSPEGMVAITMRRLAFKYGQAGGVSA